MKIVAISDTHNQHEKLNIPECDILIHCGDWTSMGYEPEVRNFAKWFSKQPAKYLVAVPGNHELIFEEELPLSRAWFQEECPRGILLIEDETVIEGVKIYGSPITPFFCRWAWNRYPHEIDKHWHRIPMDCNILVTHGPPYGILDQTTYADGTVRSDRLGCGYLLRRIQNRADLDLHFFGHIHASGGSQHHESGVSFYNVAVCDERYYPANPVTIVDYKRYTSAV